MTTEDIAPGCKHAFLSNKLNCSNLHHEGVNMFSSIPFPIVLRCTVCEYSGRPCLAMKALGRPPEPAITFYVWLRTEHDFTRDHAIKIVDAAIAVLNDPVLEARGFFGRKSVEIQGKVMFKAIPPTGGRIEDPFANGEPYDLLKDSAIKYWFEYCWNQNAYPLTPPKRDFSGTRATRRKRGTK